MAHFINYDAQLDNVFIATYRQASGYTNEDITGLVDDMKNNQSGCCPLEGSLNALEDGSLWEDEDQTILELLHHKITTHTAGRVNNEI